VSSLPPLGRHLDVVRGAEGRPLTLVPQHTRQQTISPDTHLTTSNHILVFLLPLSVVVFYFLCHLCRRCLRVTQSRRSQETLLLVRMVQKYKSQTRLYKWPFELVMTAYVRRFPTCEMIPVLVGTDILKEETSEDGAVQVIERRCKLNVDAPYLLKKMAGVDYFYCIQRNTLDRRARTLCIEAWNETFAKKIIIKEYCTYFVHPENEGWTCFQQSASMEVKSLFGFEGAVEKLAVKHYAQSIEKGKEIIQLYVQQLKEEGITFVPRFQEPVKTITEPTTGATAALESPDQDGKGKGMDRRKDIDDNMRRYSSDDSRLTSAHVRDDSEKLKDSSESQPQSRRDSSCMTDGHSVGGHNPLSSPTTPPPTTNGSVKNQVMSKAKNKICFIYNVINENIANQCESCN